jgi:hypothetical protein
MTTPVLWAFGGDRTPSGTRCPAAQFAVHVRQRLDRMVELARLRGDQKAAWRLIRERQEFVALVLRGE